jgi:cytosine/adenosine deaminase-related metal-dependent hydrolase
LTHPHIHLDRAFLSFTPEYADLLPSSGSFAEALQSTTQAKARFTVPDLINRGRWLLAASVESGVNAIRAFVEVDATVQQKCLHAASLLKEEWQSRCHVQIVCFAQDPIFSGDHGDENRKLMEEAIQNDHVDVVGTAPDIESDPETAKQNIDWAIDKALALDKHLDFHLDHNLDPGRQPLVWYVLESLIKKNWSSRTDRRVMLGHCTRLTTFSDDEWRRLAKEIHENGLPVTFAGLPSSDLYMASQPTRNEWPPTATTPAIITSAIGSSFPLPSPSLSVSPRSQSPPCSLPLPSLPLPDQPRGTLQVPTLIRKYGLDVIIGINDVGNAFTPWGTADPLSIASLGVGVYRAGTQSDSELLYECVSTRARAAMGLRTASSLSIREGDPADLLLIASSTNNLPGVVPRARLTVSSVVWDPPMWENRGVITDGSWGTTTSDAMWDCDCTSGTTIYAEDTLMHDEPLN